MEWVKISSPGGSGPESEFVGKTWNVLGDSITEKNGHSTKNYFEFANDSIGFGTINNYGLSGSTISSIYLPMSTRYSTMSATADVITVFGGTNDHVKDTPLGVFSDTTNATFYGSLHVLCQGLITKYPAKHIGFITPYNYGNYGGVFKNPNNLGNTLEQYVNIIKEVCGSYSIPVLDIFHSGNFYFPIAGQRSLYASDGAHLNITGHQRLGGKVKGFLSSL